MSISIVLSNFVKSILHGILALGLKPHGVTLFSHLNTWFDGFFVWALIWGASLMLGGSFEEVIDGELGSIVKAVSDLGIRILVVIAVCWIIRFVEFVSAKFIWLPDHHGVFGSSLFWHLFDSSLHLDNLFFNIVNHFFNLRLILVQKCLRLIVIILSMWIFERASFVGFILVCLLNRNINLVVSLDVIRIGLTVAFFPNTFCDWVDQTDLNDTWLQ